MLASEKMAKRAELYARLVVIDIDLEAALVAEPSHRASAAARDLLNERAPLCDELRAVGYFAPDIFDGDVDEAALG